MSPIDEIPLSGGNSAGGVVRVGDTVRKPSGPWSPAVDAFLRHLAAVGYENSPKSLGFDHQGRHVLEFIDGAIEMPSGPNRPDAELVRVGALIREFHDASESFVAPSDAQWRVAIAPDAEDLIVHHDIAPWNLVHGAQRMVIIDWDGAGPGSRLWDLAYACGGFAPLAPEVDVTVAARRLALVAAGYELDQRGRERLASLLVPRLRSMYELLKSGREDDVQPWHQLWDEGHGSTWLGFTEYAQKNVDALTSALLDAS
jgi:hypothetical protein